MKFTSSAVLASTVALAAARPQSQTQGGGGASPVVDPERFGAFRIFALIKDGPYAQNSSIQYSNRGLSINVEQTGKCLDTTINYATLFVSRKDDTYQPGGLFLYTDLPPMQAFVDRSGMGQGVLQFTSGVNDTLPRYAERAPWVITEDSTLEFDAGNEMVGFTACTQDQGKTFSVWMQGATHPGGNQDCTPFTAQLWPVKTADPMNPNRCFYNYP